MKAFSILMIAAASFTVLAADESADVKAMQGSWVPTKAELGGQPMPDAVLKTITLTLTNHIYEVTITGEQPDRGTWTIDTETKPKGMMITGLKGPNAGKIFPAIYELETNTLRVCYDLSGAKRPAEFKTATGTKLYLVTYKRKE